MKILGQKKYLLASTQIKAMRMPNGLFGKTVQYRTQDVDGKIFWHLPILADRINWTNRVLNESELMFTPQYLGRVYDYVVLDDLK